MSPWQPAYIGVGSNMGEPAGEVRAAIQSLGRFNRTRLVSASRLYRTKPFGPVAQGDFVNAVAGVLTQLTPQELFAALRALESERGRRRAERWGPRLLDLDLLVFGGQVVDTPELTVPHPGIRERGFVLAPLADIAPDLDVPGAGRVAAMLRALPDTGIAGVLDA
jgi:2-amino-4-hydroxy-6-hydroxymethyldihydropteridine diphosphokinase